MHDVAARHGLSLTQEARTVLSKASLATSGGALLATVMFFAKRSFRQLGAVGVLPPLSAWLDVYALGSLLDYYLGRARSSATVRIDEAEARTVREAIDRAVKRSFSPTLQVPPRSAHEHDPAEDLRDTTTRISDGLLLAAAALPLFLRRRLEAAFDEALAQTAARAAGVATGVGGSR